MNFLKERLVTWVVAIVLACVLLDLAYVQYRWSGEISQAANARIHSAVQTSMMSFREDLSRGLGELCVDLQGEQGASELNASAVAEKLQLWQKASVVPGLVKNVYLWTTSKSGAGTLLQLEASHGLFKPVALPPELQQLQPILSLIPSDRPVFPWAKTADGPPQFPEHGLQIGGIDQRVPVLVVRAAPRSNSQRDWFLVELDPQVLQQQLLPQLANRYFGDARTSNYEVAVVALSDKRQSPLYASDPALLNGGDLHEDSSLNLFGPPRIGRLPSPTPPVFEPFRFSGASTEANRGPGPGGFKFMPIRFDPIRYEGDNGDLHIVVRHRQGSIEAAVASLRRRNLALSFGVLLVLAASMALIIFNSARARRLAMLQMDFVAGVSHELRTPVSAILSISDNMASGVVHDKQQFLAYGDLIRNQARQLNHLIEQVLRFSATTKNVNNYKMRPVEVSEVIAEALENTAVLIANSGIEIHSTIEPDLPVVRADFTALSQCLQNLLTNAVKYGGTGKWIGIRAARNESGCAPEIGITIEDRGMGIDAECLKHVFDPFYRSPTVAESEVHGTGLGLALAKSFVEAMGGSITVISNVGKGTAFTIHLPIQGAQIEPETVVEQESRHL